MCVDWFFYRFEWQKRGVIHVHGLLALEFDSNVQSHAQDLELIRLYQDLIQRYDETYDTEYFAHIENPEFETVGQFYQQQQKKENSPN